MQLVKVHVHAPAFQGSEDNIGNGITYAEHISRPKKRKDDVHYYLLSMLGMRLIHIYLHYHSIGSYRYLNRIETGISIWT